jgi:GNAT superfamily N-acetyltransferase
MSDQHFRPIRLSLSREEFHRLPRNPAYKYELIGGEVWLSPRPRWHHALLDLATFAAPEAPCTEGVRLRRLQPGDWEDLPRLFAAAFRRVQPFGSLEDEARLGAARRSLDQTRFGGDGPLLEAACHVAVDTEHNRLAGGILLTLIPMVDLSDANFTARWEQPPPEDCIERRLGRPHLTWIFVSPLLAGHGMGSALLAAAVRCLLDVGFADLATTFLEGNESSTLWHWRNGFRLLPHPGSWRELSRRWH